MIDSGSTHNFVLSSLVDKLKCAVEMLPEFRVHTGSREFFLYKGVCQEVKVNYQGAGMLVDLFILSMEDINVVLGVQWSETLSNVLANYKTLTHGILRDGNVV